MSEEAFVLMFWLGVIVSCVVFGVGYFLGRVSAWKDVALKRGELPKDLEP